MREEKLRWSWGLTFEGARGRRSNRKRIVLILVARFAFSIGWNLGSPGSDAILVSSLEGGVGLRDRVWIIQGLALATTVGKFTLLAETSW